MRAIPYILYLLLIAMHHVALHEITAIGPAAINLTALIILLVAIYKEESAALWFGFVAGLMSSAATPAMMGWHGLGGALLGLAGFHVRQRINLESLYSRLLLVLGGVLLHNLYLQMMGGLDGFVYLLWSSVLTGAIYTAVLAWLYFLFKEKRITWLKIRSLF
jgi:rod shape-determining protein MreD